MKNDLGVEFGPLLCRREVSPVYAKMGRIIISATTTSTRGGVRANYSNDTMILSLAGKDWLSGLNRYARLALVI